MSGTKGFTLVELMIVTVVIGILVTMAVPSYNNSIDRAKAAKACEAVTAIRKAVISYYYETDTWENDLTILGPHVGVIFPANDDVWTYEVDLGAAGAFTVTAERIAGRYRDQTIIINELGEFSGTYNGPGDPKFSS